ncbi:MAG: hypothetical protein MZV49_26280 [Rhodopseudomonas palustris]|nr:hypothetical protein [Rhodopseudomonas palustris]
MPSRWPRRRAGAALRGRPCARRLTPLNLRRAPGAVLEAQPVPARRLRQHLGAGSEAGPGRARLREGGRPPGRGAGGQRIPARRAHAPSSVPGELSKALETSGIFDVATGVSTDWPADQGISGLRELAARYRSEYLILYRHRFVDRNWTNPWGWAYVASPAPSWSRRQTLETAGVLEATLFDVQTGSILFTVFERVGSTRIANIWYNDLKRRDMQERLLAQAAGKLAQQVVTRARKLAMRRPRRHGPVVAERGQREAAERSVPGADRPGGRGTNL